MRTPSRYASSIPGRGSPRTTRAGCSIASSGRPTRRGSRAPVSASRSRRRSSTPTADRSASRAVRATVRASRFGCRAPAPPWVRRRDLRRITDSGEGWNPVRRIARTVDRGEDADMHISDSADSVVSSATAGPGGIVLLEQLPLVTYVAQFDAPRTLEYVSPQVCGLLGFAAEEPPLEPAFWADRVVADDRERFEAACDAVRSTGEHVSVEYRLRAHDG